MLLKFILPLQLGIKIDIALTVKDIYFGIFESIDV
jgi:hypothetical protein